MKRPKFDMFVYGRLVFGFQALGPCSLRLQNHTFKLIVQYVLQ